MSDNICPNVFPRTTTELPYRIAVIGEAPGAEEVVSKVPFSGQSGRLLDYLLNKANILRSGCFIGNVCQHRPVGNEITSLPWDGVEIQSGLTALSLDLQTFNPNLCLLLGATALRAAKGFPESIGNWRGSLFLGAPGTPFSGRKCIASYHPASALRVYEQTPLLLFDLNRARKEATTQTLVLPEREFQLELSVDEIIQRLCDIRSRAQTNPIRVGTDIEGYVDNLLCLSISETPGTGFMVAFVDGRGSRHIEYDELRLWEATKGFLEDAKVEKVWQNGLYDRFVFAYNYGIVVRGSTQDTMVGHWELYCELPKKLALQTSIYTKQPYYKDERHADNWLDFWRYGCMDSAVTLEANQKQLAMMSPEQKQHYYFNVAMQDPLLHMELRGMKYDMPEAKRVAGEIKTEMYKLQGVLNKASGTTIDPITTPNQAVTLMKEAFAHRKLLAVTTTLDHILPNCRKTNLDDAQAAMAVCRQGFPFNDSQMAEFTMSIGKGMNVEAPQQVQSFLYHQLMLPIQYDKKTKQPTADALALLILFKKTENPVLKLILKVKHLSTRLQTLSIKDDPDGRVRCSYNVVGTVTGRLSCSKSPTRSGYNLQTVTKKLRYLFRADDDNWFFQCDLEGADLWTVAAHCARLGDPTMLEDLRAGIKPTKILALMYKAGGVERLSRDDIKTQLKQIDWNEGWLYMGCKRVVHGSDYLMGKQTMSNQILDDSYKYAGEPVLVEPSKCGELQQLYFRRYPGVLAWHRWVQEQLKLTRSLTSGCGHKRNFFGRPNDNSTLQAALAHEPQVNTTYATNRATLALWNDSENRRADGSVIIEPLHSIHDALAGQFPKSSVAWAIPKIRSYFNNVLTIAGQNIQIPFEGSYGESWGQLTEGTI